MSNEASSPRVGEWLSGEHGSVDAEAIARIGCPMVEGGEPAAFLTVCAVHDELDARVAEPLIRASASAISGRLAES